MTCIVGIETPDGVWIGGDSAAVAGSFVGARGNGKVFRNGDFLIGSSGSHRMNQLLRYAWQPPTPPTDVSDDALLRWMVTDAIDSIRDLFKDKGHALETNEQESFGGKFLVAVRDRLFVVAGDYQVWDTLHPYAAIGSGRDYALGSLHSTARWANPKARVHAALQAAIEFCGSVRGPGWIERA